MPPIPNPQLIQDAEHIKLLSIFSYVHAGLVALATLWPLVYVVMGLFFTSFTPTPSTSAPASLTPSPAHSSGSAAPSGAPSVRPVGPSPVSSSSAADAKMMGWIFFTIGVVMAVGFLVLAVLNFLAARSLSNRRGRIFILIVAGINMLMMPLGTALGVFTMIVILRPSVQSVFEGKTAALGASA